MPRSSLPERSGASRCRCAMLMALAVLLVVFLAPPGAAADTKQAPRDVSGALRYPENVALPKGARVVVEVKGAFGTTLGQTDLSVQDDRTPLPFALSIVPDLPGTLSAVVRLDGAPRWLVQDVAVRAGTGDVALGALQLAEITPLAFAHQLDCGDTRVSVGVKGEHMILRAQGRDIALRQVPAASGAKYQGVTEPETEVFTKGDAALVTLNGQRLPDCTPAPSPVQAPYRAGSSEPGWSAQLQGQTLKLSLYDGSRAETLPRPAPVPVPGAYLFKLPQVDLTLRIEPRLCANPATGMPHPDTATLDVHGLHFTGCGGDPFDLLSGAWQVTSVDGYPTADPTRATLIFPDRDTVLGGTGCNRFTGAARLTGEGLTLGPVASTRMACPEPMAQQEQRFLDALEKTLQFYVSDSGLLHLIGPDGPVLRARRAN